MRHVVSFVIALVLIVLGVLMALFGHIRFVNFIALGFASSAGWIMWTILLIGFVGMGIVIERVWYLYLECDWGTGTFLRGISTYLKSGDYERAIKFATGNNSPLAKGVLAILQGRSKGPKAIKKAVDEVFLAEGPRVKRNIHLVNTIANLATLVGLTGTIFGTMECLDAIANAPAAQRAQQLAQGISITMSATLFGLCVAVPSILVHGILTGKADKIIEDMDEKTTKLINAIEE
jgi:biopolymer transport protein ExbB